MSIHDSSTNASDETNTNPFGKPTLLDDLTKEIKHAVGAPCPALQNDGGSPGDAGNTTTTAKDIGSNPTTSFVGCADGTDAEDWYEFTMDADNNIDVVLSNFGGSTTSDDQDYDIGIYIDDPNIGTGFVDTSTQYRTTSERVSTVGTAIDGVAGTYWIVVVPYNDQTASPPVTSQGDYDIETWTLVAGI